ncbi:6-bladed beta-propeller [Maribellus comscasis]|uniref:6-bladed beta-propeller n=1 Tax=Maribellus comscasis TaxID=2681766 RepID=A0A6I6JV68_9BACT|nr:6-bladed beta-propeller [Maribellus comscasis]QGY46986.1 6-bladed beta-propeller [Maribellus comscasis]
MKKLSILLTLIIVLFSCKQKKEIDNIIDLTSITEPTETNLSELGSEIRYIPLETNADCLIPQIYKLIYEGGAYFLGSTNANTNNEKPKKDAPPPPPTMPTRSLYRFSKDGEFICQISHKGGAPSEYIDIFDFLYNKSNNTINIFILNDIKEFSLEGSWKKNITIENKKVSSIGYSNNQILGFVENPEGQNEYSFLLFDANGQITNKYENKYRFVSTQGTYFHPECIFYQYNGIIHCKELHSDTIFSFDNGTFIPKYILKQGEAKFIPDLREDPQYLYKNLGKFIIQKNCFESKNYLFYQYRWKKKDNFFIQNKSNGNQYLIDNGTGLVNDLDNGPNFKIQNTITVDGTEYLVSWINTFELKAHVASNEFKNSVPKFPEKKKKLEQLANSLDENDNPVLMLVKLKN